MKREFIAFARTVNTCCGQMNAGLTAVAVSLGILVLVMAAIRAPDYLPQSVMPMPAAAPGNPIQTGGIP